MSKLSETFTNCDRSHTKSQTTLTRHGIDNSLSEEHFENEMTKIIC